MDDWKDRLIELQMDCVTGGWMDGWMDGRVDRSMDYIIIRCMNGLMSFTLKHENQ